MSNKKKKKNSDYRYLQRQQDERREAREKEERKKAEAKNKWLYIAGIVFLFGSIIAGVYAYTQGLANVAAPYYSVASGVGMLLLGTYYKDKREKYSKVCYGFGIGMMILAYFMYRAAING